MNKKQHITLSSLFDGIGGFPYAASFFGIEPLWASEVMPTAVSVTKRHLPNMAHLGDITKLHGGSVPPVDIITFGSPCQGLSNAGKRLGFLDPRSGLFTEAIRIIREMREATNGKYPRFALWENVPGALHANTGFDFKAVLEAFAETEVPFPERGKWANAGMVRGGNAHIAWCVYNAQHFGTAQRRRRIFLIADFTDECAGEILFIPRGLQGYFEAGGTPRQGSAAYAAGSSDSAVTVLNDQGGDSITVEKGGYSPTLRSQTHGNLPIVAGSLTPWDVQSRRIHEIDGTWPALYGGEGGGHGYVADPCSPHCLNAWDTQQSRVFTEDGSAPTLAGADGGGGRNPAGLVLTEAQPIPIHDRATRYQGGGPSRNGDGSGNGLGVGKEGDPAPTITAGDRHAVAVQCPENAPVYPINMQNATRHRALVDNTGFGVGNDGDPAFTLMGAHCHAVGVHQGQTGSITTAPTAYSLTTSGSASARNAPLVAHEVHPETAGTLCASGAGLSRPGGMASETDLCVAYCLQGNMIGREDHNGPCGSGVNEDVSFCLNTVDRHAVAQSVQAKSVAFSLDSAESNSMKSSNPHSGCRVTDTARTIDTTVPCPSKNQGGMAIVQQSETPSSGMPEPYQKVVGALCCGDEKGVGNQYVLQNKCVIDCGYIVRRLTPTECERLMGFPDGWTEFDHEGKPISDTKRYMMLGNSVAVPCVAYILQGMAEILSRKEDA